MQMVKNQEVFDLVSDSNNDYILLCIFVGWGCVGDFYVGIGKGYSFFKALFIEVNAGVTVI